MANTSQTGLINQDALTGTFFALLAAVGFSAKAYLHALNKLHSKRERAHPQV